MIKMPILSKIQSDARYIQIIGQTTFLCWGILFLGWQEVAGTMFIALASCLVMQGIAIFLGWAPLHSLRSALITGLGLSLLLRVNDPLLMMAAATLAISQKFLLRWKGYHFWNPANFAIAVLVYCSQDAWVSPAQWGQEISIMVLIFFLGVIILKQIHRWDTALFYMTTLALLVVIRFQWYLGWDFSVSFHQLTTGSFWLYSLFMITDPMSTPQHKVARRIWAMALAGLTFYLQFFMFIPTAAVWALFVMTPWVPLINVLNKEKMFSWIK